MKEQIIDFIKRRFPVDCKWLDGNCYWMAFILSERFPELQIVYESVLGHFMVTDGENYYDWTGIVDKKSFCKTPITLEEVKNICPLWYERIIRDCKN